MDKEELKKLLAQLTDSDLADVGLQKKTSTAKSVRDSIRSDADKTREITAQAVATRDLTKALSNYASTLKELKMDSDKLGFGEDFLAMALGVESVEDAHNLLEITSGLEEATKGLGNSIAEAFGGDASNKFAKTLDSITSRMSKMGTVIANALESGNARMLGIAAVASSVQISLELFFTAFTSIANGIYEMSKTVILAFDQTQAKVNATTGAIYAFNDVLYEAQREVNAFGISFEEAGNALLSLNRGLSFFKGANTDTQSQLIQTVAGLTKFGISTEESTKLLSFFTNNLGMLPAEADKATKQLAFLSTAIGIDPAKMTADFMKASSSLAVYGERTVKVFSNIAAAAKAAEVETSSLLSLAEKFDTFSGAAETTGKLNAILGSQLSALEMLSQTEDQRIETLIRSVQAQGVAFGQMDRFTKKAIAAAAGISDMNEAQRIFGMNISQYRNFANQQQKSADIQQQFNDALKAATPLVDKFRVLFTEFVVGLKPVFTFLNDTMDSILDFIENMNTDTKELIASFALIASSIGAVVIAGLSMAAAFVVGVIFPLKLGIAELLGLGSAAGGAVGSIGGGAGVAATGLGVLTPELFAATGGLGGIAGGSGPAGAGLLFVGKAGNSAGASISAGMAKAALGIGIAVVALVALAAAVAMVVSSFADLAEAEARQDEAKARQIEGFSRLSQSISQVEQSLVNIANIDLTAGLAQIIELAETLKNFDDVSIETKHTLTNLALITTGTAAEVMTASAAGQTFNIDNVVQNAISLEGIKVNVKVGEQEFADAVMKVVRDNQ